MKKRIWLHFIRDHWLFSIIYFIAIILIALFYQITTESAVEIIYPLSIGIYAYLIMIVIRGISYYGFYKKIEKSISNPQYDFHPTTAEQQEVSNAIRAIHQNYIRRLHTQQMEHETQQQFLSQWIHNLKTPISIIDLTTQKQVIELSEAIEALSSVSEENEKLHHSVEQLLSLIRLENFAKDYVPEQIDLKEETKQIINGLKNQFVINHVFPKLNILVEDTQVFSDRKWHKLMLEQFISNAVKYSNQSKITEQSEQLKQMEQSIQSEKPNYLEHTIQPELPKHMEEEQEETIKQVWITLVAEENGLCLSIKDEGIGIPEYDLYRIFEPFFTGDNGRKVSSATGIGLYIADTVARRLGHKIEVASTVGEGTTISIHYTKNNLSKL